MLARRIEGPRSMGIRGLGFYVPEGVVTNDELARAVDTSDEWITEKLGIKTRRFAAPDQASSDLGIAAARAALRDAGVSAEELVSAALLQRSHVALDEYEEPNTKLLFWSFVKTNEVLVPLPVQSQLGTFGTVPARTVAPVSWIQLCCFPPAKKLSAAAVMGNFTIAAPHWSANSTPVLDAKPGFLSR